MKVSKFHTTNVFQNKIVYQIYIISNKLRKIFIFICNQVRLNDIYKYPPDNSLADVLHKYIRVNNNRLVLIVVYRTRFFRSYNSFYVI